MIYQGSYYVLEVGNCDETSDSSATSTSNHASVTDHRYLGVSDSTSTNEIVPLAGENGYFMLNTDDPSLSIGNEGEEEDVYSHVATTRRAAKYENISKFSAFQKKEESSKVTTSIVDGDNKRSSVPPLHPHLVMVELADNEEGSETSSVHSGARGSMYENMDTPTSRKATPTEAGQDRFVHSYENIQPRLSLTPPPDSSSTSNPTPFANTTALERPVVKRSAQQRRDVYEIVPIKSRASKVGDMGGASHQGNMSASPENGT